jgi:tetratricopeptide (TPR) repeat protein
MFDWEEEGQEDSFRDELERFESLVNSGNIGFFDSDTLEGVVDHYLISGFYSKAENAASIGMDQYPFQGIFFIRKAQALSGLGRLREALELMDVAETKLVNLTELYATKAAVFSQLKDSKRAIALYKKALLHADDEEKDDIFLDLATELQQINDFKGAVDILTQAMQLNPNNEGALYELAFCFDQLEDTEQAINAYKRFLDENPYSYTAWYNLGNTFSKSNQFSEAIEAYEYCVAINEQFSPAYFNLGNAYISNEQHVKAIDAFLQCIAIDGEDAHSLVYLAEAYENNEQLDLAWDNYQKALSHAPDLAEAWIGLGIVKDLEGNSKSGLRYIERALELDPDSSSYYHVYAGALENSDMIDEANDAYLKSLELDPSNEDCYFDYVDFLIVNHIGIVRSFVEQYTYKHQQLFSILPMIYLSWTSGETQLAKLMLIECYNKDPEKTKEIFERFPDLAEVEELLNLTRD